MGRGGLSYGSHTLGHEELEDPHVSLEAAIGRGDALLREDLGKAPVRRPRRVVVYVRAFLVVHCVLVYKCASGSNEVRSVHTGDLGIRECMILYIRA